METEERKMIACSQCGKDVEKDPSGGILINCDGDFVCNEECKKEYEKEKEHFFNHVIGNDKAYAAWLGVPESWVKSI